MLPRDAVMEAKGGDRPFCSRTPMCGAPDCEQGKERRLRNLVVVDVTLLQAAASSTQTGFRQTQLGVVPVVRRDVEQMWSRNTKPRSYTGL